MKEKKQNATEGISIIQFLKTNQEKRERALISGCFHSWGLHYRLYIH